MARGAISVGFVFRISAVSVFRISIGCGLRISRCFVFRILWSRDFRGLRVVSISVGLQISVLISPGSEFPWCVVSGFVFRISVGCGLGSEFPWSQDFCGSPDFPGFRISVVSKISGFGLPQKEFVECVQESHQIVFSHSSIYY